MDDEKLELVAFNYAECPIKEWIADYFDIDVGVLFKDVPDEYGEIFFISDGNNYRAYLESRKSGVVPPPMCEYQKQSIILLTSSVAEIFDKISCTVDKKYAKELSRIRPMYDRATLSYKWGIMPQALQDKYDIEKTIPLVKKKINKLVSDIEVSSTPDKLKMLEREKGVLKKLRTLLSESIKILNRDLEKNKTFQKLLDTKNRLYIIVETYKPEDISDLKKFNMLPKFSSNEESLSDLLDNSL